MNIILLFPNDFIGPQQVRLEGRRLDHVRTVHRASPGETLKVGLVDGPMGEGRVLRMDETALELEVHLDTPPPPKLPLTLVLALPRPKVLNRVLAAATALGVARIQLLNSYRVEKAYWNSPRMAQANLDLQRILGLEQARDTGMPTLELKRFFRPFVEDELGPQSAGGLRLVAHPGGSVACPRAVEGPVTLVVGPEGGFIPFEIDLLEKAGFQPVDLGARILRVETAVATLIGRLF